MKTREQILVEYQIRAQGMIAENLNRATEDKSLAYSEEQFLLLIDEMNRELEEVDFLRSQRYN